jgi:hypothetical protein
MHSLNLYKHEMSFSNVFRYMCTVFSKHTMPIFLKTKCLLFIGSLVCSRSVVCFHSESYTAKDTTQVVCFLSFLVPFHNFPPMPFISLIASTNTWMHLLMSLNEKGKKLFILMVFYELPKKGRALLTLFIPCILIELNCSFMTPTNATLTHTNTVLLPLLQVSMPRQCQGVLRQDLKLTKT